MRVLFWTDWFLPSIGGVEVFSGRLLPALAARGHEITVVAGHHCAGLPDAAELGGVGVRRFPFHSVLAANDLERMADILRRLARLEHDLLPELVHLNTLGPSVLFHRSTPGHKAPTLLTMHSPVTADALRPDTLYGQVLRSANAINCNSRAVHADLCRLVPELRQRSSVTYYGMETPAVAPAPRPRAEPVVLAYGRLVAEKGFDVAIRAFAGVLRPFPSARLVLAGTGAAEPELRHLVVELGIGAAVEFVGPVAPADVPALLNTASVVVVPSRWDEPFGLVALEAALMARPVVATRAGGLVEVVEHGVTGWLTDKDDTLAIADALARLLGDPTAADRMGAMARERACGRFAWKPCVDEYERLYEQTLMEARHG